MEELFDVFTVIQADRQKSSGFFTEKHVNNIKCPLKSYSTIQAAIFIKS